MPAPKTQAIVKPEIIQQSRTRELRQEEIDLLKRTVAKGTTDDEFALFLWVCRKHKLDPLTRQLHCVKRWSSADQMDVMAIQTGIDGYRAMAGRDHPDFGGCDEPEFEFEGTQKKVPSKATIRLWKKGLEHPIVGVAYWNEYAPTDINAPKAFMWKKMPKHMLAKCAEALALRKGYPELADIYTNEEMAQAGDDFTPTGRQIVTPEETGSIEAAQAVAQRKIAEYNAKKEAEAANTPQEPVESAPRKIVFIKTLPNHDLAVSGYLADEAMQKFLADIDAKRFQSAKDGGVYYRFGPDSLADFKTLCQRLEVKESDSATAFPKAQQAERAGASSSETKQEAPARPQK